MSKIKKKAWTTLHAQVSLCLLFPLFTPHAAPSLASHYNIFLHQTEPCHGNVEVMVDPTWQISHPQCTIQAAPPTDGKPPVVTIYGSQSCLVSSPTQIAKVHIDYPECEMTESYSVSIVNGIVEVDLIDPM